MDIYGAIPAGEDMDDDCLKQALTNWISQFTAHDYQENLVAYVAHVQKPMNIDCSDLQYAMVAFNDMVEWLPGDMPALNEVQLKQAYYDSMPRGWKERYAEKNCHASADSMNELRSFFTMCERTAAQSGVIMRPDSGNRPVHDAAVDSKTDPIRGLQH